MSASSPAWLDTSRSIGGELQQLVKGGVLLARVVVERLVDDPGDGTETLQFSYRGVDYETDISTRDGRALDKLLEPYLKAARRRQKPSTVRRSVRSASSGAPTARVVRAWARDEGVEVSDRGRLPADLLNRYLEAHSR